MVTKPNIIDRRTSALGYPGHGIYPLRNHSAIKYIVWHYTGTTGSNIVSHEQYWRNSNGWDIGGYHYYIDRNGKIFQNYNWNVCTYGAGNGNPYTLHISVEASSKDNYTSAQEKSREELTLWLMSQLGLSGDKMRGHKEIPGNSTSCPGYSVNELTAFRNHLSAKLGGKSSSSPSSGSNGVVNAGFLKYEYGKFTCTVNDGIVTRDGASLKANKIGLLKKGESVVYTDVHIQDGFVWLRYGVGTKDQFLPVREVGKDAWGTFAEVPKQSNDVIAKEILSGIWGNGKFRKARIENARYDYNAVQKRVQELKAVPKKEVKPADKPIGKTKDDNEFTINGKTYVVVEK